MDFLVFSDSHGVRGRMIDVIQRSKPDVVIHLGDGNREFEDIASADKTGRIFISVKGNCDSFCFGVPSERIFTFEGKTFLAVHGHKFGVKGGTEALENYARAKKVDIVLYGHTHIAEERHIPADENGKELYIMNPGSISAENPVNFGTVTIRNGQVLLNTASEEEQ